MTIRAVTAAKRSRQHVRWRGPAEQVNLVMSKRGGTIVLDPQVPGSCVISLDEQGATTLGNLLSVWLE